jgi:serine/threonine protein kinase
MATRTDSYPAIFLPTTDPDLPERLPVGMEKYSDFQEMSRGLKAVLHSCWDSVMGRTVALKRLLPDFASDPRERRRFLREARITAQLQHPNTVPVYEIGRTDDGLYFTMKRIAGENLFRIVQRLSWGDAATLREYPLGALLDVVVQTGLALAYAHVHGVIHRDVKPENIWLGRFGEVVLLDWGVAKVWGHYDEAGDESAPAPTPRLATSQDPQLQTLTQEGQLPGTPLYMSPEQVLGHRYIDERTDVFSLGVVLYEMLTFTEPFRGRHVRETFDNIIHERPLPPGERAPQRGIPEALDRLVLKAIEKDPQDRFESMSEMVAALRDVRRGMA